jgi:hypothetical protein
MEPNAGGATFALLAREVAGGLCYPGAALVTLRQPARDQLWARTEAISSPTAVSRAAYTRGDARTPSNCLNGTYRPPLTSP